MNIIILYQNKEELDRIKNYIKIYENISFGNISLGNIIYFKSFDYNNEKFNFNTVNYFNTINYNNIYKKMYTKKLNQNQLNHLLSIKKILELSIEKKYNSIMILEYDIYFHKKFNDLIKKYSVLINNNDIIHLGSSQHKWFDIITNEKINIKQWKGYKYYNNSHSLGTFAIILKSNIYLDYINFINYVLTSYQYIPSDVILSIISKNYKSIVLYPNIVICNLDNSSIIKKNRSGDYIKFKWYKDKYLI